MKLLAKELFLLVLTAALISCEKSRDTDPSVTAFFDTIRPLEYFPAFPGSYWVYDNDDTLKVAGQYEKYIFNSAGYTAMPDYDTLVLPKLILNGIYNPGDSFAYVREYSISKASLSSYRDPAFKQILSLNEGDALLIGGAVQGHQITGRVIEADTSIRIEGKTYEHVIVTIHFDRMCTMNGFSESECAFRREYYARGVGLIKRESRNYPIDTVFVKEIALRHFDIKEP